MHRHRPRLLAQLQYTLGRLFALQGDAVQRRVELAGDVGDAVSGANAISRGRWPTSTDLTTLSVRVSITETAWSDSFVTNTQRPSGATATPSGSSPTGMLATDLAARDVHDGGAPRILIRHEQARLVDAQGELFGIRAGREARRTTLCVCRIDDRDAVGAQITLEFRAFLVRHRRRAFRQSAHGDE